LDGLNSLIKNLHSNALDRLSTILLEEPSFFSKESLPADLAQKCYRMLQKTGLSKRDDVRIQAQRGLRAFFNHASDPAKIEFLKTIELNCILGNQPHEGLAEVVLTTPFAVKFRSEITESFKEMRKIMAHTRRQRTEPKVTATKTSFTATSPSIPKHLMNPQKHTQWNFPGDVGPDKHPKRTKHLGPSPLTR
ncbi:MAG TPA: hypothetical protein PLV25_07985, partial [Opitutales bacterium]|nr:hypothetical protein [Opitutales bacterium]